MSLNDILLAIKKAFVPRKDVDFEETGLHFEMETLTSMEDVKTLESCKDLDGTQYIEGLKRNTLAHALKLMSIRNEDGTTTKYDLTNELIEYTDEETGETKTKSKFLYMVDFLAQWPPDIIDVLFDAFSDMVVESREKVKKNAKFERFKISEKPAEDKKKEMRPVTEDENLEDLDENEKLEKKVEKEIAEADKALYEAQDKAESK